MITIRDETPKDHNTVHELTVSAFTSSEFGHNGEAALIDSLRANCDCCLSLVACSADHVVGHILFTPVAIRTSTEETHGMGLAPMSVAPHHQRIGIGSSLVTAGLNQLFDDHCPFVVVLGHPDYYPRFGFLPAADYGISHGFSGSPQELFFISFRPSTATGCDGGMAYYRSEFGPQHKQPG